MEVYIFIGALLVFDGGFFEGGFQPTPGFTIALQSLSSTITNHVSYDIESSSLIKMKLVSRIIAIFSFHLIVHSRKKLIQNSE